MKLHLEFFLNPPGYQFTEKELEIVENVSRVYEINDDDKLEQDCIMRCVWCMFNILVMAAGLLPSCNYKKRLILR